MASGITIEDLITKVQHDIGEAAGPGVQTYSEDRILERIKKIFNIAYTAYPWPWYSQYLELVLDGSTGVITTDAFENVRNPEDIIAVMRSGEDRGLPTLPTRINPYRLNGTKIQYWSFLPVTDASFKKRLLQFWPKAATDDIVVHCRVYPTTFVPETILYLDEDLLSFGAAWLTMDGEGLNASSTETMKELFDLRFKSIMSALANHPSDVTGGLPVYNYLSDWHPGI